MVYNGLNLPMDQVKKFFFKCFSVVTVASLWIYNDEYQLKTVRSMAVNV